MKTHLSGYIILAVIITVLTASGLMTQNVYAAHHALTIVVKDLKTDEEFQCPIPLATPIILNISADAGRKPQHSIGATTSMTIFYRSENIDVNATYYLNIAPHPAVTHPRGGARDIIIEPGPGQFFEAYLITRAWRTKEPFELRQQLDFVSLEDGEECEFVAISAGNEFSLRFQVGGRSSR